MIATRFHNEGSGPDRTSVLLEIEMGHARGDNRTVSLPDAATTPGAGTLISALCTYRLFLLFPLCDTSSCLRCDRCCKGRAANGWGYRDFIACATIPADGGRPPPVTVPAQHRRVGAYRLGKDHAHGADSVLYGPDTRYPRGVFFLTFFFDVRSDGCLIGEGEG